jgi:hypothetical protein
MKKFIFTLITLALLLISCSKEAIDTNESSEDLKVLLEENTNIGTYKGVFTTINSEFRGKVEIEIIDFNNATLAESFHRATITLQNGEILFATSTDKITSNNSVKQAKFSSKDINFHFAVNQDGSNPIITNVVYNNIISDVIVAKHTTRAPVTSIIGTYNCVDCNLEEKTFSFIISNDGTGNQTYTTQVNFNGVTYSAGGGYQNNCIVDADESTLTFCDAFSGVDGGSDVGFLIGGDPNKPVTWEAETIYNNETSGSDDCTTINGVWFFRKGDTEEKSGVITSDSVEFSDNCLTFLAFEGFGGVSQSYTSSIPEFTDNEKTYFIRTNGDDIASSVDINDVVAEYFFAAQDTDDSPSTGALPVNLTFENLDVTGLSTIYFSAQFAEDDTGASQHWDSTDYVHVDYSFDNGLTWVTFFGIESDGSNNNTAPFIDTDLDGTGDGQEITDTLQNFRASFANNGTTNPTGSNTVSVRIEIRLNAENEDIAIDNVLIRGL